MSEMAQGGSSIVWSVSDGSLHKVQPVYATTDCMDIDCNLTATDRGREPLLPPCCVCGEKASGFHYGANTCEACKTFFRRSQSRKVVYTCGYNGECVIGPTRKRCSSCRLDKCLAMGMAKTAIKTGRYTSEKRTAVIKEVNRLKVLRLMNNEGVSCRMTLEGTSKLDNIVEQLTNFFLDECARRVTFSDGGYKKEQQFLERRALENQMFDGLRNIPNEEYKEVVQMTGMDIDGRQKLLSRYVPSCEKLLQYFTSFCKQVPGFNRMSYEDQKSLMKGSSLDCMCLQFSHLYNVEEGTCLLPYADNLVYSQDEVICLYNNKEDQLQVWEMFKRVQMLDLTVDERALAGAIVLMNANAELSEAGRRIASISTDFLIQVLLHLFDKNHDKEERTFTRLMSILTELRTRTLLMLKVQMCVNENSVDWNIPKSNIYSDFFSPNSEH